MTFTPFDTNHSPHIDVTMNQATGMVYITVAFHPHNRGGYDCRLYELAPPYTGLPILKRDWKQGANHIDGPFGHGASLLLPTGGLLTAAPIGFESADNIRPAVQIEEGYGEPYQLGSGPPGPPGEPGNGGITFLPTPALSPLWEGRVLSVGEWVDIPAVFNVPSASHYLIRFVAQAPQINVRVRAGTPEYPFWVSVNTQAPNLQMHAQGWTPGPSVYVSAVNGAAQVWLQVLALAGQHQAPQVYLPAM